MTGAALRAGAAFGLAFTLLVGAIRWLPRPESDMRFFLTPPANCPMPCWQGIQPGVTRADEAVEILAGHVWGGEVVTNYYDAAAGSGIIGWTFPDDRLIEIERFRNVRLHVRGGVVYTISLPPRIPFSDVWMTYGTPSGAEWLIVDRLNAAGFRLEQNFAYENAGVYVSNRTRCPATLAELWGAASNVQIGEPVYSYAIEPIVHVSQGNGYSMSALLRAQVACQ